MFEITRHPVADAVRQRAHLDNDAYLRLYQQSVEQPDTTAGFIPDYLEIRNAVNLRPAQVDDHHLVILTAAQLGSTRLIDNLVVELPRQ
ncbi:hypothetical protein N619_04920 [Ectopseudomonas oleovorans]|nr:hypothetical protein N619_04920 [Pseudomonas oleovorans]